MLGPIQAANRDPALALNPPRRSESELLPLPPLATPLPPPPPPSGSTSGLLSSWRVPELALRILPRIFLRPFGFVAMGCCCWCATGIGIWLTYCDTGCCGCCWEDLSTD